MAIRTTKNHRGIILAKKPSRAIARKIRDKWKAKTWYKIIAPEMFNKIEIGETPSDDPQKLVGRVSEVTVHDLTGDFSKMHIKLQFKINDVHSSDAHTRFTGHDLTSDYVRRLTRRKRSRTDSTFDVYTKDKYFLRVKPLAITEKRIQSSCQSIIRGIMGTVIEKTAREKNLGEFVKTIISGELAKNISIACKPIYPIKRVEIRKSEVLESGIKPKVEEEIEEKIEEEKKPKKKEVKEKKEKKKEKTPRAQPKTTKKEKKKS